MPFDTDIVRRWTRLLTALRSRRRKLDLGSAATAATVAELTDESLEISAGILQDLAGSQLDCERLRAVARAEASQRYHVLEHLPIACIVADVEGVIEYANPPASLLLNVSPKHLRGRLLLHFSSDRVAFARLLAELPVGGGSLDAPLPVRPRERGPSRLHALIIPAGAPEASSWLWFLTPVGAAEEHSASESDAYSTSTRNTA